MKKHLLPILAAVAAVCAFPACTTVHEDHTPPVTHTSTTTTSESVMHRPVGSAVESTTVRSY